METTPRFLQGIFPFEGNGLHKPVLPDEALRYQVPLGVRAQALYFRGGNAADALVVAVLVRDGVPMRYFPIGATGAVHIPLRVVEDLDSGSVLELQVAAHEGVSGEVVVDLGLVEV